MAPQQKKSVALNRKARFEYTIGDVTEAGIVLTGTEVKSLRAGKASIQDAHIEEYLQGNRNNHNPLRHRKLLMKKREINKFIGQLKTKGVTLIPLELYFNERGVAKLALGVATGKKQHEKREAIKERDWKREQGRLMKGERD
jgi:SsrA-binding protein